MVWRLERDDVVVRASASQLVDLGFILLVESHKKTLENGIHSFPAWRSAVTTSRPKDSDTIRFLVNGE